MYNSDTNTWNALPPSYDCILRHNESTSSNDNSSNYKDDDGNNNTDSNSATTTTTTTTFKQYMTISNEDVDYQQKNGEKDGNDDNYNNNNNKNKNENDDDHNHNRIFGRVYSISRLVERFGCSEENNNALLPTTEIK
jgi:hypothetical protein